MLQYYPTLYEKVQNPKKLISTFRSSAKQHYIWTHLQNGSKKNANWYESRPKWLQTRGGKRVKGVVTIKPVKKNRKLPDDFLIYSPIGHEEQYRLVRERQQSRNYQEARYQCDKCYRGFRGILTYNKHMKKHDPVSIFYKKIIEILSRARFRNFDVEVTIENASEFIPG